MRLLLLKICLLPALLFAQKSARLNPILNENSGLVVAAPDSIWMINDGGNQPIVWQIDRKGAIRQFTLLENVPNRDWEELAIDRQTGTLFIGDFGNNLNSRRDLCIFLFNPKTGRLDSLQFGFPDQTAFPPASPDDRNFDCEAMVFWRDSLHLFSKSHWQGRSFLCRHYVVAAQPGRQSVSLKEEIVLKKRVVSGAAISPDGQKLALVGYRFGRRWGFLPYSKATIFMFSSFSGTRFFEGKMKTRRTPGLFLDRQYEALDFLNDHELLLSNERLLFQKAKIRRVRIK